MPEMKPVTLITAVQRHLTLPGERLTVADFKKLTPEDRSDLVAAFEAMGQPILVRAN